VMVIYTPSPIVASEIAPRTPSWRDTLPIHPAANLFPRIADAELRELGTDIRKNGLLSPIVLWRPDKDAPVQLLDGRSRLDALELALGRPVRVTTRSGTWRIETDEDGKPVLVTDLIAEESGGLDQAAVVIFCGDDPYAYAASANVHRRHLTIEQKRELITKLLKAGPEKSDRQIAETTKTDHKTVAVVRRQAEGRGEIPHVEKRNDRKGRSQPAHKEKSSEASTARCEPAGACRGTGSESPPIQADPPKEARDDIGPASTGEAARKLARLEELEAEVVRLRRVNLALESEVQELKSEVSRLERENDALRGAPAKGQGDEMPDLPACLRREPPTPRS
jgi:ParB-like nuclease domain